MSSFIQALVELAVTTSAAAAIVMLVRRHLGTVAGPAVAYWLWLLVPISALATLLPPLPSGFGATRLLPRALSVVAVEASGRVEHATVDYSALATILWGVGCAFMLALVIHRHLALLRAVADARRPAADGVYRSSSVGDPLLVGILRPKIVVPIDFESRYTPEDRALILAHERAHLRRGDVPIRAIATLWLCAFWFNPLMHWALARLRLDQEMACDAAVLAAAGSSRRRYADALLKTHLASEARRPTPVACSWESGHPLKERIVMLSRPPPSLTRRLCGAAVAAALVLSGGCAAWSVQPAAVNVHPDEVSNDSSTIHADRVVTDDGDVLLSGNVVITLVSGSAHVTSGSGGARLERVGEGHYVIEAQRDLRLADDKFVITAEGGRLERNGDSIVLTTESARISPVSPTPRD